MQTWVSCHWHCVCVRQRDRETEGERDCERVKQSITCGAVIKKKEDYEHQTEKWMTMCRDRPCKCWCGGSVSRYPGPDCWLNCSIHSKIAAGQWIGLRWQTPCKRTTSKVLWKWIRRWFKGLQTWKDLWAVEAGVDFSSSWGKMFKKKIGRNHSHGPQ